MENYFVIQERTKPWEDKWITLPEKYETFSAAVNAFKKMHPLEKKMRRIAEAYFVVRYKTVKIPDQIKAELE